MSKKGRNRSRIGQLRRRKSLQNRVLWIFVRLAGWAIVAGIINIIIFSLFDTPKERQLQQLNQGLDRDLTRLQSRYDSLEVVLANLEARDRQIFNTMFESEPYDIDSEQKREQVKLYESLIGRTNHELREILAAKVNVIDGSITELVSTTERMVKSIDTLGNKSRRIPAIQPIVNDQLTLLTASFGERLNPYYNKRQRHTGVDYTIPQGTRVFATADGIIKRYTLSSSDTGKSVVVDHQNGYETIYNHLSKIDFPRNYRVKRGDIIGMSGNTGLSFSPHLHYEIRYKGVSVDPIDYFFMELNPMEYQQILRIAQYGMQSFD